MQMFSGQILSKDGVVVAKVDAWIEVMQKGGLKSWHGSCSLPAHSHIDPNQATYQILLDDGRSGEIIITNFSISSHGNPSIRFQGSGPLG